MWFNNLTVYQLGTDFAKNDIDITAGLNSLELKPCAPHARQSYGFSNPCQETDQKVYSLNSCHLIATAKETRLLPTSIIQAVLSEKLKAYELLHNRPMRRADRLQLKEEIEFELLPKAFIVTKKDWLYFDNMKQWLVINHGNPNKIAEILALLTKALGSLNADILTPKATLSTKFSNWLTSTLPLPENLMLGKNCILINEEEDKSQYTCRDIEQNMEEINTLLSQGYVVSSLELLWQDRIQFVLTDNFLLKRLRCLGYLAEAFKDNNKTNDSQEAMAANFSLMTSEIRNLLTFLIDTLGETNLGKNRPIIGAKIASPALV